jgi:hypothetical protein
MNVVRLISKILAIMIIFFVIAYLIFANTIPFDINQTYRSNGKNELLLTPASRVKALNSISKQTEDTIYFNSDMKFYYDTGNTKIYFKNPSKTQQILLGYRDQEEWHYNTQVLDDPLLNNLNWQKTGKAPYLYQKVPGYKSVNEFIKHPPDNKIVGIADYKDSNFLQTYIDIPNYQAAKTNTIIDVPLRGKTTMYAYLKNEPFTMTFYKRDLNWRSDPDVTKINIYKGDSSVYNATIDDDGNTSNNRQPGQVQSITIKNPGPGLPEAGVYKIVIDAPNDSLITKITTNLHKIAFEGPLYLANNNIVYKGSIDKTIPSILTTNAHTMSFRSDHNQSPSVQVDKQIINIKAPNEYYTTNTNASNTNIIIPESDMIINSSGYFSFTTDQFFAPTPYKILPINSAEDITQADYILTNYKTPKHEGDWLVAEREFGLHDAVIQKGQLSWLLSAPGLKENKRTVEYKSIEMTLTKKGWFKQ